MKNRYLKAIFSSCVCRGSDYQCRMLGFSECCYDLKKFLNS